MSAASTISRAVCTRLSSSVAPSGSRDTIPLSSFDADRSPRAVRAIPIADHVYDFVLALTRGTRVRATDPLPFLKDWVTWGAGLRGGQQLILAAKSWALLHGHFHVSIDSVKRLAIPTLRHRVITNYFAESEGITPEEIIVRIIKALPEPASGIR